MRPRAVFKYLNMFNAIKTYVVESAHEIKKVSWPTKQQTKNYTLLVIAFSLCMAVFLGLLDVLLSRGLELLIG